MTNRNISTAVQELKLPRQLSRRLDRHLDGAFAHRGEAQPSLRRVVRDVAVHLEARGVDAAEVAKQLRDTARAHASERGFERNTILTGVPMHTALFATVERWATERLSGITEIRTRGGGGTPRLLEWRRSVGLAHLRSRRNSDDTVRSI